MSNVKIFIYNLARKSVMNRLTRNLGKVIEEDDKLICYVNKNKCWKDGSFTYTIPCSEISSSVEKKMANSYGINKPIYYVIDGIDFGKHPVHVFGYDNAKVIIRNCNFPYGLLVSVHGDCLLENNHIRPFHRLMIGANNITIKDMSICNEFKYTGYLNINIGADNNLSIVNSNIGRLQENTNVSLTGVNELNLDNSNILGSMIECEGKKMINHHGSSLVSDGEVNIKSNDFERIRIESPIIVVNGNKVNNRYETTILKQITNPLSLKRLELIELLKQVKDKCEMINLEDSQKYEEELNGRTISKVLTK